jgi:hypothetical protein
VLTYSARLSWDNFPFRKYSPGLIYALVLAWWMNMPTSCATN